jgi:hypothetical protein
MRLFQQYACLDYSGAASRSLQRRHIVLAVYTKAGKNAKIITGLDRSEMGRRLLDIFRQAAEKGSRIILGIDHNFGFPQGFYEALTGYPLQDWRQWLDLIQHGPLSLKTADGDPRIWAQMINRIIGLKYHTTDGPFWGPGFITSKKPRFDFSVTPFNERRLIEQRIPRTQPVFKIGGAGSVGLQSLHGLYHLSVLEEALRCAQIAPFFWPQDGFDPPPDQPVITEIYPAIINQGLKSDLRDAESGARWLKESDHDGSLGDGFRYSNNPSLMQQVRTEGWIPGVPF